MYLNFRGIQLKYRNFYNAFYGILLEIDLHVASLCYHVYFRSIGIFFASHINMDYCKCPLMIKF